jgi:hypothetical protein
MPSVFFLDCGTTGTSGTAERPVTAEAAEKNLEDAENDKRA